MGRFYVQASWQRNARNNKTPHLTFPTPGVNAVFSSFLYLRVTANDRLLRTLRPHCSRHPYM